MLNPTRKVTDRENASAIGVQRFPRSPRASHVQADAPHVPSLQNLHSEPLLNQPQLSNFARSASKGQPRLGRIVEAEEEAVLAGNTVTSTSAPSTESPRYSWRGPGDGGGGGGVPGGGSTSLERLSSLVKNAQQRLSQHSKPTANIKPTVTEEPGAPRQKPSQNLKKSSENLEKLSWNLETRAVDMSGDGQSKVNTSPEQEKAERAAQQRAQFMRQQGIQDRNSHTGDQDIGGSGGSAQQDDSARKEGAVGVGGEGSGVLELIDKLLKDERRSGDEKESEQHGFGVGRGGWDEGRGVEVPFSPEVPPRKKEKKKTSVSSPGVGGVAKMMQVASEWQQRCIQAEDSLQKVFSRVSQMSAAVDCKRQEVADCHQVIGQLKIEVTRLASSLAQMRQALDQTHIQQQNLRLKICTLEAAAKRAKHSQQRSDDEHAWIPQSPVAGDVTDFNTARDVRAAPLFIANESANTSMGEGGGLRESRLLADGGVSGEGEADGSGGGVGAGSRGVGGDVKDSRKATLAALMSKLKDEVFVSLVPCALSRVRTLSRALSRVRSLACALSRALSRVRSLACAHSRALTRVRSLARTRSLTLIRARTRALAPHSIFRFIPQTPSLLHALSSSLFVSFLVDFGRCVFLPSTTSYGSLSRFPLCTIGINRSGKRERTTTERPPPAQPSIRKRHTSIPHPRTRRLQPSLPFPTPTPTSRASSPAYSQCSHPPTHLILASRSSSPAYSRHPRRDGNDGPISVATLWERAKHIRGRKCSRSRRERHPGGRWKGGWWKWGLEGGRGEMEGRSWGGGRGTGGQWYGGADKGGVPGAGSVGHGMEG
jgi:hypothetical protein